MVLNLQNNFTKNEDWLVLKGFEAFVYLYLCVFLCVRVNHNDLSSSIYQLLDT